MIGYFITGTDTGVGKTFVTASLTRLARARGHRVFAFKPIETGCEVFHGERRGPDQELLARAAGDWQQGRLRGVYRLLQPAAPLVAAEAEGVEIDAAQISATLVEGAAQADLVLVEGAGGWRVPITPDLDMAGLSRLCGLPVLIVARAGLGTINHALLTIEAVERSGQVVAAVLLSRLPADDADFAQSNADQIRRRWPGLVAVVTGEAELAPLLAPLLG